MRNSFDIDGGVEDGCDRYEVSPPLSHYSLHLKPFSFPIRYKSITCTHLSDAAPPPSSARAATLLVHAVYARSPVYTYINAAARPRTGVLPLPGGPGHVVPTTPVFDLTTESKGINDFGIVTLERASAAG